ncbi:MAG: O-antigen ligase family protein [Anaerolineales bacterium]|nr:O-antigen ligase family protein [Anaerolineales bacterium]
MMDKFFSMPNLQRVSRLLWGLLLLSVPVTSFRYMPDFLGATLVRPLSFIPLLALLPVLLLIFLRNRRVPLPPNFNLLMAFVLFGLVASLIGVLFAPIPLRNAIYEERVLRGWFSFLIGLAFFFAAFWMTRGQSDLNTALKWIYAGLGLTVAWSLVQALAQHTDLIPRGLISDLQSYISIRPLVPRRVSGFAYEPSWLGDQINVFYLPWLFAALLKGRSLFKQKWVEWLLLGLTWAVLVFSYSRGGLIIGLAATVVVGVIMGRDRLAATWQWFRTPLHQGSLTAAGLRLGLLLLVLLGLFSTVSFLAEYDYFASLWDFASRDNLLDYIINISAGPRLGYALAGWEVFSAHPISGVGLGAAGLYLFEHYPDWIIQAPDAARHLVPSSNLIPNIKSLYVRLLAETGLPGFWLFMTFFLSFFASVRRMAISGDKFLQFVATAGLFALVALSMRNATQDSLTFPIMWITLGMLAGLTPGIQSFAWKAHREKN